MTRKPPTPNELVRAHATLARLSSAIFDDYNEIRDMDGNPTWDALVDGRRMLAVTTAWLGAYYATEYGEAWERMMEGRAR